MKGNLMSGQIGFEIERDDTKITFVTTDVLAVDMIAVLAVSTSTRLADGPEKYLPE